MLIHPNQGELLSADQNGTIKQWVLASNECDLELVGITFIFYTSFKRSQAPVADVPMRSITMAHDGSFLVAGNHKVRKQKVCAQDPAHMIVIGRLLRMEDYRSPKPPNAIQSRS